MAFVYRYLHPRSEAVFYIGKTGGDEISSLAARISAHANEDKFKKSKPRGGYIIEYVEGLSAADADILETALINATDLTPRLNSSKTGWEKPGLVRLDDLTWKPWSPDLKSKKKPFLEWNAPDHCDAVYSCECCGNKETVGRSGSPRYVLLKTHSASAQYIATIWLCDECSESVCGSLKRLMEDLRGLRRKYRDD